MNSLNAAHLLLLLLVPFATPLSLVIVWPPAGNAAICAKFLLNLSFSILINISFFFMAPGRLFKLLCLIFTSPTTVMPLESLVVSGNASAKDWRVVTSFFDGRLLLLDGAFDFSMREMRAECLIMRLSFFVLLKNPSLLCSLRSVLTTVELELETQEPTESRLPVVGAYIR